MTPMRRTPCPCPAAAALLATWMAAGATAAEPIVVVLVERGPPVADIACPANGQTLFCLDAESGGVTAVDPGGIVKPRLVVAAAADGSRARAIASIETNTLAAVCRKEAEWSLRSWRLRPDEPVPAAEPLQEVPLGEAAAGSDAVHLLVGHSRDWLAVSGPPEPLPPLLRGPIARASVGRLSDRGCPPPSAAGPVVAMTADPADALVLFTAPRQGAAGAVAFHDLTGRTLLELASDLPRIRDAASCRGDGTLWVVAGDRAVADRPEGLWRIDAAIDDGRQVLRPVCVARLTGPTAVACVGNSAVVVAHGDAGRRLVRIDLVPGKPAAPAAPDKEPVP